MNIKVMGGHKLTGEIYPSGSKQVIVTLIPCSLLFDKPLTLSNVPEITDVTRLVDIMTKMGSKITWDKTAKTMFIDNSAVKFDPLAKEDIGTNKGIRGTTLLWGPMLARFGKVVSDEQPAGCTLGTRPIDAHYQAFLDLGVQVTQSDSGVILDRSNAKAGNVWLLEASPTATENVIMFAVTLPGVTTIYHAACEPNVQELCHFLNKAGADIRGIGSNRLEIYGGKSITAVDYRIIADLYEIGTFLALGAITGGEIKVHDALPEHLLSVIREFAKFGINVTQQGELAIIAANQKPVIVKTRGPLIVRAQPWPALPVDLLPVYIPLAMAAPTGQALFHNWMYESGLYWTSEFLKMGANVVMCDPHRVLVTGGNKLKGCKLDAPYIIRAAISLTMAAMMADGETIIQNADTIHRGHPNFVANLKKLGAQIEEV